MARHCYRWHWDEDSQGGPIFLAQHHSPSHSGSQWAPPSPTLLLPSQEGCYSSFQWRWWCLHCCLGRVSWWILLTLYSFFCLVSPVPVPFLEVVSNNRLLLEVQRPCPSIYGNFTITNHFIILSLSLGAPCLFCNLVVLTLPSGFHRVVT